ncbi:hypothetical protein GUJ93_ZPchr0012g22193 [Zizania palustris]|uniref:40S ribosomal protein S30 n=8 Tax=Mesangiospermae TaxID=1437183 RepID=A0A8J5WLX2_ZIZPA|nr:hypothetical protein GUJ93_ZPchr0012g22193 [Zizania palustris]
MGKVHGSLARAGKVRGQTPKVAKQDKKKKPRGRAHKRMQHNRRFVTAVVGFGKKRGPNSSEKRYNLSLNLFMMRHAQMHACGHLLDDNRRPNVLGIEKYASGEAKQSIVASGAYSKKFVHDFHEMGRAKHMGKFYELLEMDAHAGAKELDLHYMKIETPKQLELFHKKPGVEYKIVRWEICAMVTKGTLDFRIVRWEICAMVTKGTLDFRVHDNACLATVVVTQTLDWKLHAFDVLSKLDPNNEGSNNPMLHLEWLVRTLYTPMELRKSDQINRSTRSRMIGPARRESSQVFCRTMVLLAELNTRIQQKTEGELGEAKQSIVASGAYSKKFVHDFHEMGRAKHMGKFYELLEMDAHAGAKELDLHYMKIETPKQLELFHKKPGVEYKIVRWEICAMVTKGTLDFRIVRWEICAMVTKGTLDFRVHDNACLATVVVTQTLDWKLHAFDVLSKLDPNNEGSNNPMLHLEWLVRTLYTPMELRKSDQINRSTRSRMIGPARRESSQVFCRTMVLLAELNTRIQQKTEGEVILRKLGEAKQSIVASGVYSKKFVHDFHEMGRAKHMGKFYELLEMDAHAGAKELDLHYMKIETPKQLELFHKKPGVEYKIVRWEICAMVTKGTLDFRIVRWEICAMVTKGTLDFRVHDNACLATVVVTQTLDWKLHAFDVLSKLDPNNEGSNNPMLHLEWLVRTLYTPMELRKSDQINRSTRSRMIGPARRESSQVFCRTMVLLAELNTRIQQKTEGEVILRKLGEAKQSIVASGVYSKKFVHDFHEMGRAKHMGKFYELLEMDAHAGAKELDLHYMKIETPKQLELFHKKPGVEYKIVRWEICAMVTKGTLDFRIVRWEICAMVTKGTLDFRHLEWLVRTLYTPMELRKSDQINRSTRSRMIGPARRESSQVFCRTMVLLAELNTRIQQKTEGEVILRKLGEAKQSIVASGVYSKKFVHDFHEMGRAKHMGKFYELLEMDAHAGAKELDLHYMKIVRWEICAMVTKGTLDFRIVRWEICAMVTKGTLDFRVHDNACLATVVVTQTLDWKLHAFDVLSKLDPNNEGSNNPMLHLEWLVRTLYTPMELRKSDQINRSTRSRMIGPARRESSQVFCRTMVLLAELNTRIQQKTEGEVILRKLGEAKQSIVASGVYSKKFVHDFHEMGRAKHMGKFYELLEMDAHAGAKELDLHYMKIETPKQLELFHKKPGVEYKIVRWEICAMVTKGTLDFRIVRWEICAMVTKGTLDFRVVKEVVILLKLYKWPQNDSVLIH